MKKAWKKLLATMLAGVMALSCVVTAGATEPTPPSDHDGVGAVDPADTGVAVTDDGQKTETKYASGNAKGTSRSEGRPGVDPVRIELPTIDQATLNMILDPYGLINGTNAARYASDDYAVSFAENTPLYFLNSITPDADDAEAPATYAFTNETQTFTVTNKSHLPVGLDVTLQVDKGGENFSFVKSLDALSATAAEGDEEVEDGDDDADAASGALMYLALKKGETPYAVEDVEEIIGVPTIENPVLVEGEDDEPDTNVLAGEITASVPTAAGNSGYPKAVFQWATAMSKDEESGEVAAVDVDDETKEAFNTALGEAGKNITVAFDQEDDDTAPTLTITAADVGDYEATPSPNVITNTTYDTNVTVTYADEDGNAVAYVYFVVKADALAATDGEYKYEDGNDVVLTVMAPEEVAATAQARFTDSIPMNENAYVKGWDASGGYFWAFVEEADDNDLTGWGQADAKESVGEYESISFSITGSINAPDKDAKTSVWDGIGSKITLNLIWDVFEVGDNVEAASGPKGDKASITDVSPATGTKSSNRNATINFGGATEDYEEYVVTAVKFDDETVAVSGTTSVTVNTMTTGFRDAESFALVFTNEDTGDSYEVAITDALF